MRFVSGTVFDVTQTKEIDAEPAGDGPIAVVSPEIAAAFGMANLPNVRIEPADQPVIDGWICDKAAEPAAGPELATIEPFRLT